MSMLSAQCDDLRKTADELQVFIDNAHNYTWHGIFTILHYAQQVLRSAADIIWELRNKLAGTVDQQDEIELLKDENAKLREQVTRLQSDWESERDYADQMEAKEKKAVGENAKLRELCGDLFDRLMDKDEHCGECRSQCEHDAWNFGDPKCVYAKRMRELGIWEEQ